MDPAAGRLFPRIETARLRLRAFRLADAAEVQRLAGDRQVADGTLLPHPYEGGAARAWIWDQALEFTEGRSISFAIERAEDGVLVGAIGLEIDRVGACAKLGYWLGRAYWGRGYATEAVARDPRLGFAVLELERIFAPRFRWNAASARVLRTRPGTPKKAAAANTSRRAPARRRSGRTGSCAGNGKRDARAARRPRCIRIPARAVRQRLARPTHGDPVTMGFVQLRRQPVQLVAPTPAISVRHAEASDADALHAIFTDPR